MRQEVSVGCQGEVAQTAMFDKLQFVAWRYQALFFGSGDKLKFVGHRRFQSREFEDDLLDVAAHHRLAAGQTNFLNPEFDKDVAGVLDLFVREHLFFRCNRRLAMRQAIEAAKVAAVGQRHTQIANRSIVGVFEKCGHYT